MLKKEHRLKKNKHFTYIYNKGVKLYGIHLNLIYVRSKFEVFKVGFSVSKKIGKAFVRNKVKRRLREAVKKAKNIRNFTNYVFIAKSGIEKLSFNEIFIEINLLIGRVK